MAAPKATAPYVAVRTDVRKDERFEILGQIAGYNKYEALGRVEHLWMWCRDRKLEDAPEDCDGYAVSEGVITAFLGERGVRAILADGVDALALGERREDGLIYLRGTSETVTALRACARSAAAGGKARASAPRKGGRFTSTSQEPAADQPVTSRSPADDQPLASHEPAGDQPEPAYLLPPTSVDLTPARAKERHPDAGRVARALWNRGAVLHSELKASVDPTAQPWSAVPSPSSKGWELLLDRACELLVGRTADEAIERGKHAVEVVAAEARAKGTLRYFVAPLMFRAESFEIALSLSPEQVARRAGGGANTNKPPPKFAVIPSRLAQRKEAS